MSDRSDYEVIGRVSAGPSGAVWKARDVGLDRLVALKEIVDSAAPEVQALAALSSDQLVQVFGVVTDGGRTFLVEEWVDGATLREVLRASGQLSVAQALGVVRGALLGLADVHRAGMVHGDISPSNILVDANGVSRLIDFGSTVRTGERVRASTGAFAAPEVLAGAPTTASADVFASAGVLAMLLHGRPDMRPSTRGVEEPVRGVLDRALDADPARRYPDAVQFLAALEEAAQRRYGAAWFTQAGLGALATASSAELLTSLSGAPFSTSGSGVMAEPAPTKALADSVRSTSRRNVLIGAGVVAAAAVLVVVFTSGDDKKGSPAADLPASHTTSAVPAAPPSSATPAAAVLTASDFTGTYHFVEVVTVSRGIRKADPEGRVGARFVRTWRIVASCSGARCGASVTSSSGAKFHFQQQGTAWRFAFKGPADCRSDDTGKLVGRVEHTVTYVLHPVAGAPGAAPRSYTGSESETAAPAFTCPAVRVVGSVVLTRTG